MPKLKSPDTERGLIYYQSVTAAFAAVLLVCGLVGYLGEGFDPFLTGLFVRIGATMAVVALAMPQLFQLRRKLPSIVGGIAVCTLVIIAVRPRIGNVLLTLLVMALFAHGFLGWLSRLTGSKRG